MDPEMNRRLLAIVSIAVAAIIVIGAAIYLATNHSGQLNNASQAPVDSGVNVGQTAPEFTIPSTAGEFDLAKQTQPVFIEIFATWCPHCQRETVVLNKLYAAYGKRVAFIAIPGSDTGMDGSSPESQFDIINFQIRFSVKYPIGAYDPNLAVARQYLKGGYPTIVIVGRDKRVAYANSGETPYNVLAAALNAALK
jgi:cytochrome c biogenesis protein CcmG, thiol:disulfide interchange protein DsbE